MSHSSTWEALRCRPRTHTNHNFLGLYMWREEEEGQGGSRLTEEKTGAQEKVLDWPEPTKTQPFHS